MSTDAPTSPSDRSRGSMPRAGNVIDGKHEAHRIYQIIGVDDECVERTAREVAEASKLLSNVHLWSANFRATIGRVRKWCETREPALRGALVDIRSNKVLFYFVPVSERYDLVLGNQMTELEVELGGNAGIGYVESLQIPARSLERFAGPKSLIIWERPGDNLFVSEPAIQSDALH